MSTVTYAGTPVETDAEGFFVHPEQWSDEMAPEIAAANGIAEPTHRHRQVIDLCGLATLVTMPLEPSTRPTISVVVPTHNDAGRITDALASIAAQTYAPTELIVSDDASTDDTRAVVDRFARRCGIPVRYLRNHMRSGVVRTRNNGISAATGAWIANCDSDDYWEPTKLARQVAWVRDWTGSPISLLGTHGLNVNDKRRVISPAVMGPATEHEYQRLREAGGIFFVIHSSTLFARTDYETVGGYSDDYGSADDFHFFCNMSRLGVVVVVPAPLTYYRKRAGSIQLSSFWDQRYQLDRLSENEQRRVRGETILDWDAFCELRADWLVPGRRNGYLRYGRAKYHYRRGTVDFVNGRRGRGAVHLLRGVLIERDLGRVRKLAIGALRHRFRRPTR